MRFRDRLRTRSRCVSSASLWAAAVLASALLAGGPAPATAAAAALQQLDVVLLQPGPVLERRLGGVDALAEHVRAAGAAATAAIQAHPEQIPSAGFIVIALRPGGGCRTWLDFKPALAEATVRTLAASVQAVPAPPIRGGPVVYALRVALWGARPPGAYAPAPPEWRDAAREAGHALETDAMIDRLWPPAATPARPATSEPAAPAGAAEPAAPAEAAEPAAPAGASEPAAPAGASEPAAPAAGG